MADIYPFYGVRYSQEIVGNLANVVCPPYDVISPDEQITLQQSSPYNAVRLELGEVRADDEEGDRYRRSREFLEQWLDSQVLLRDAKPAFYLLQEEFPEAGRIVVRQSLMANVRLEEFGRGSVLPHERTRAAAKRDRLALMQTCKANFSPIMALYRDSSGKLLRELDLKTKTPPNAEIKIPQICQYRMWTIDEPVTVAKIQEILSAQPLYLADGHHRYETALVYRDTQRAISSNSQEKPYDFVFMALIDIEDPGLKVQSYHRILKGMNSSNIATLKSRIEDMFDVALVSQTTSNGLGEANLVIDNLMSRDTLEVAIGVVGLYENGPVVLTNPKKNFLQELAADAPSNSLLQCEPWLLQEGVLVPALGIRGDEESNVLVMDFSHDADQIANAISSGEYQIGFLMRAVPLNVLEGVVRDGALLPPKSTYFAPKLLTGVVFNLLD